MHECGHGSLFRSGRLNRGFGFVFGVLCGMPQFVWSQHHQFHHAHNGNWDRYRGPLNTAPVAEYAAMSVDQQRRYRRERSIWLAPCGRLHVRDRASAADLAARQRRAAAPCARGQMGRCARADRRAGRRATSTPCWASTAAVAAHDLRTTWRCWRCGACCCGCIGPLLFFGFYLVSVSLAGGAGLLLFAVQHNFEQSYASGDEGWDYTRGAIEGTSFLQLPGWLNWFTANIAYHHIHHLSARIPSYCLAACHDEYAMHFTA